MQRQGFSLIDQKLAKLQPSENGLNLRFRATEGTYLVESTSLLRNHVIAFIMARLTVVRGPLCFCPVRPYVRPSMGVKTFFV